MSLLITLGAINKITKHWQIGYKRNYIIIKEHYQ